MKRDITNLSYHIPDKTAIPVLSPYTKALCGAQKMPKGDGTTVMDASSYRSGLPKGERPGSHLNKMHQTPFKAPAGCWNNLPANGLEIRRERVTADGGRATQEKGWRERLGRNGATGRGRDLASGLRGSGNEPFRAKVGAR